MAKTKMRSLGSGKIEPSGSQTKWIEAAADSLEDNAKNIPVNTQYIPLSLVDIDQNNPRDLLLTPQILREAIATTPLPSAHQHDPNDNDWIDDYILSIGFADRIAQELDSILRFAFSLGEATRLVHPVTVTRTGERFELLTGERRFLAHIALGEDLILARILSDKPGPFERSRLQWEENQQTESLSTIDKIRNLEVLLDAWRLENDNKTISVNQFSRLTGLKRSVAHRYLAIIKANDAQIMKGLENGSCSLMEAGRLATMSAKERKSALNKKKAAPTSSTASMITLNAASDYSPIAYIIHATAEKLSNPTLLKALGELDLTDRKQVSSALALIIAGIGDHGEK